MDNEEKIKKMMECPICLRYLAHCMVEPVRCGGLLYNDKNQLVTKTGKLWREVLEENEQKEKVAREKFYIDNKKHLEKHFKEYVDEI
jgi:hypothetical protein